MKMSFKKVETRASEAALGRQSADWEQKLVQAGCRMTGSRRAVMRVLQSASTPLMPQEILAQARSLHEHLGLVTVYRTLNLLTEMDLVRRVHREDGCHGYFRASPGHHHAVICRQCGAATEFPGSYDLEQLVRLVQVRTGYRVEDHLLQLWGVCPHCQDPGN